LTRKDGVSALAGNDRVVGLVAEDEVVGFVAEYEVEAGSIGALAGRQWARGRLIAGDAATVAAHAGGRDIGLGLGAGSG
jgi:hypothetical protein